MRLSGVLEAAEEAGAGAEILAAIREAFEDEAEAEIESMAAAAFEDAAHGYDLDEEAGRTYDPSTGISVYDLDPGISYNDAGEPRGFM